MDIDERVGELGKSEVSAGPFLVSDFCEEIGHIVRSTRKRSRREWGYGETPTPLSRIVRFSTAHEIGKQTLEHIPTACQLTS